MHLVDPIMWGLQTPHPHLMREEQTSLRTGAFPNDCYISHIIWHASCTTSSKRLSYHTPATLYYVSIHIHTYPYISIHIHTYPYISIQITSTLYLWCLIFPCISINYISIHLPYGLRLCQGSTPSLEGPPLKGMRQRQGTARPSLERSLQCRVSAGVGIPPHIEIIWVSTMRSPQTL